MPQQNLVPIPALLSSAGQPQQNHPADLYAKRNSRGWINANHLTSDEDDLPTVWAQRKLGSRICPCEPFVSFDYLKLLCHMLSSLAAGCRRHAS